MRSTGVRKVCSGSSVAASFYGENETFRRRLQQLEVGYVLALKPSHGWRHPIKKIGSLAKVAETADWEGAERPGAWQAVTRRFRDGHNETWWALESVAGPYGPEKRQRAVIVTTDPRQLPALTTWYLVTNLPALRSERAAMSALEPASLDEIVRLYGLRMWVEESYKQVKRALGWAEYQVRSDVAIRRHWTLVWCAFSFCWWHLGQGAWEGPPGWQEHMEAPLREAGQPEEGAERGKTSGQQAGSDQAYAGLLRCARYELGWSRGSCSNGIGERGHRRPRPLNSRHCSPGSSVAFRSTSMNHFIPCQQSTVIRTDVKHKHICSLQ